MAATTTKNFGWSEIDPEGEIDVAKDVNTPLEQIDASLKEVKDSAKTYTFKDGLRETLSDTGYEVGMTIPVMPGSGNLSLIENIYPNTKSSTRAKGINSHSEGSSYSDGNTSHAEGSGCRAHAAACHAEGHNSNAVGIYSHSENEGYANGFCSHSEGNSKTGENGSYAHAEGLSTEANGSASHAEGTGCIANGDSQHVFGCWNKANTTSLEIVGNGTNNIRKNVRTLSKDGTQWNAGDLTCDAVQGSHDKVYSLRQVAAFVETLPAIEFGTSNAVTVPAVSQATVEVTFGSAKTEAPVLFVNLQHSAAYGDLTWYVQSVTNQQAAIVVVNNGSEEATGITVDWLAISGR